MGNEGTLCVCVCVCVLPLRTHGEHVVALHVPGAAVLALVVELAEEVEGDHGVEIHHHRQQAHRQGQLEHAHTDTHTHTHTHAHAH